MNSYIKSEKVSAKKYEQENHKKIYDLSDGGHDYSGIICISGNGKSTL